MREIVFGEVLFLLIYMCVEYGFYLKVYIVCNVVIIR